MKTIIIILAMAVTPAFCQIRTTPVAQDQQAGQTTVVGTVTAYDAAKEIEVTTNGVARKYDLSNADVKYSISPEVATGMTVKVIERTDAEGHKSVLIQPSAA